MTAAPIAGYPLRWEVDVLLADGGVAHLRLSGPRLAGACGGRGRRSNRCETNGKGFPAGDYSAPAARGGEVDVPVDRPAQHPPMKGLDSD